MTSSDVLDAALALQLVRGRRPDPGGHRPAARRLPPPRRGAPRDADDRPLARHPRRADHRRAWCSPASTPSSAARGARWSRRAHEIAVGKIAGAVGTYANLDPAIESARARRRSACAPETVATQIVARDRHAALFAALARARHRRRADRAHRPPLAAHRGGRGEEAFGKGQKGSSAMPHKKNPILSENLCGLARLLRAYAQAGARGRGALARARHLALVGRARDRPRRDRPRRLHGPRAPPASSTGWSSTPSRMRAEPGPHGRALLQRGGAAGAGAQGHGAPGRPTSWCSATRSRRRRRGEGSFRELLARRPRHRRRASTRPRSTAPSISNTTCATPARSSTARSRRRSLSREERHDHRSTNRDPRASSTRRWTRPTSPSSARSTRARCATATCATGGGRIVVTDRLSAFDVVLGTIPFKGQVLNQMAAFWFEATADLAPNHVINVPDPNVMVARECEPLPVEFVMRALPDRRHLDVDLDALRERRAHVLRPRAARRHEEEPAAAAGDPHAVDQGREGRPRRVGVARRDPRDGRAVAPTTSTAPPRCARALFAFGQQRGARRGLILVDTKYEIGRRPDGALVLHRRDPHARLVALLVRRRLRGALRARRGAARPRQGVRAPHARRPGLPAATARRRSCPTRCASRRRAATSRSASWSPAARSCPTPRSRARASAAT